MIVILMGVTGAGKTTVGSLLAGQLGWEFVDGDSFHSAANIEKIRQGIPLDEADRRPWLEALHRAVVRWIAEHRNVVLACSALRQAYREQLCVGPEVQPFYLKGSYEVIARRLRLRHGHFATEKILSSQFATLEEPEYAATVEVDRSPEAVAAEIRENLKAQRAQRTAAENAEKS